MTEQLERSGAAENSGWRLHDFDAGDSGRGDYRGRFGYGRPAHGSDPHATYSFGLWGLLASSRDGAQRRLARTETG